MAAVVEKLKAKGLTSPYLKPFVVARVNYTRFSKATSFDFDETLDKIIASAQKFNTERINQQDVAKAGGGGPVEDGLTRPRSGAGADADGRAVRPLRVAAAAHHRRRSPACRCRW